MLNLHFLVLKVAFRMFGPPIQWVLSVLSQTTPGPYPGFVVQNLSHDLRTAATFLRQASSDSNPSTLNHSVTDCKDGKTVVHHLCKNLYAFLSLKHCSAFHALMVVVNLVHMMAICSMVSWWIQLWAPRSSYFKLEINLLLMQSCPLNFLLVFW